MNQCSTCNNKLCISKVAIFEKLDRGDLLEILKLIEHLTFNKGDFLTKEGDLLSSMFILNEGSVKLTKYNQEGKEQILNILTEGDVFGEYHLFSDNEPYNYSAIALTDVKLCALRKEEMDYLIQKHPIIGKKLMGGLSRKLIQAQNLVQNLSNVNTSSKVAFILLEIANQYGHLEDGHMVVPIPMTREELANYAGVTRETMSRKLGAFNKEQLIETVGNKIIVIKDIEALKSIITN